VRFLEKVFASANVVGFDVVELSPMDSYHAADFLAAKLVYKLITLKYKSGSQV
jgi:agmatinase